MLGLLLGMGLEPESWLLKRTFAVWFDGGNCLLFILHLRQKIAPKRNRLTSAENG